MSKIFVSIPAWDDSTLVATVKSMLSNASNPDRIVIGFGLSYSELPEPDLSFVTNKHYILRDSSDYAVESPGIIQVRNALRRLITDEDYYLSIDAHAVFDKGWDESLIADLEELHKISDKYVISKQVMERGSEGNYYTKWSIDESSVVSGMPALDTDGSFISNKLVNEKYFLNYYTSGNFIFAKSDWCKNMHFPDYHGYPFEEQELSLVTFCSGYDVVSPISDACYIFAGNDPKYEFPYDERWWEFVGTDKNNKNHWIKKWRMDDPYLIMQARFLLVDGQNDFYSLLDAPRSFYSFYDTIGFDLRGEE